MLVDPFGAGGLWFNVGVGGARRKGRLSTGERLGRAQGVAVLQLDAKAFGQGMAYLGRSFSRHVAAELPCDS